jgi:ubiquinone/menaquinone biosynthesis C-methylase UbiE
MTDERKNRIRSAYDKAAENYAETLFWELNDKPLERKFLDLFFERVNNHGHVLEIGCGPGEISSYLRMRGLETITGLDISPRMVELARKRCPMIVFEVADVFDLPYEKESIAGVAAPYLIVNFSADETARAIKEIHRVLEPGGILYLNFHCGDKVYEATDFFAPGNTLEFMLHDPERIAGIVRDKGFTIIEKVIRDPYVGHESPTVRCTIMASKV